jgi:hypothetical protein
MAPTAYVHTTSQALAAPRFDHDPVTGESLGLLVEEQRTNQLQYSEQLNNGYWLKRGTASISADVATAPDGTATADLVSGIDTGTNDLYNSDFSTNTSFTVGAAYAVTFWIKKSSSSGILRVNNPNSLASGRWEIDFSALDGDWTRIDENHPAVSVLSPFVGHTGNRGGVALSAVSGGPLSFYLWGMQAEVGTFPSSYIPTTGSAQTRYADIAAVQDEDFATTNLLSYSESFDVGWSTLGLGTGSAPVITSNYGTAPDGTPSRSTRIQFDLNGGTSSSDQSLIYQIPLNVTNTYTNSIYIKGAAGQNIYFGRDIGNKIIVTTDGTWQRANFTYTNKDLIVLGSRGTTGSSDSIDVEIWGASLTATEYPVAYTTTRNLLTDSQDFERSGWSKVRLRPVLPNATAAPDGTTTADYIEQAAGQTSAGATYQSKSLTGNEVTSVYAKAAEKSWLRIQHVGGASAYFNLTTCEVGTTSGPYFDFASSEDAGNGWCRLSLGTNLATASIVVGFYLADTDNSSTVTDSGGIYLYGAQLEPGTTATDYVRTVDTVGKSYGWYEPTEGTVFVDFANTLQTGNVRFAQLDDGTEPNRLQIGASSGTNNIAIVLSGSVQYNQTFSRLTDAKIGTAFKYNNANAAQNGTASTPDTNVALPIFTTLRFGQTSSGTEKPNGHIKRLTYWPVRQSDSTLQVITQ